MMHVTVFYTSSLNMDIMWSCPENNTVKHQYETIEVVQNAWIVVITVQDGYVVLKVKSFQCITICLVICKLFSTCYPTKFCVKVLWYIEISLNTDAFNHLGAKEV